MARKTTIARRASLAVDALQKAWEQLQQVIDCLPVGVMGILTVGSRGHNGHFAPRSWRSRRPNGAHEIAINPALFTDSTQLLETLVHEAAHAVLFEEDPGRAQHDAGCSLKDPRYHTSIFRDKCVEVGLECKMANRRYGFTDTRWPATGVPEQYGVVLALLRKEMPLGARPTRKRPEPKWNPLVKVDCQCDPPRIVYIRRGESIVSGIRCEDCVCLFERVQSSQVVGARGGE